MRKDQQFVQNQLMPFLKGIMTDAKESGKSFYKYFGAERKNKEAFINSKELYRYKYGTNSLFESDTEAEKGFGVLIDELFAKMQREFHYGMHKTYMPDENGEFSQRQEEALFKLSGNLIEKINFKEKQTPEQKTEENEKTIKETNYRFGLARVNVTEPFHLNPETGLIEGKIVNINDPTGSYLIVKIDPVDPELIYFEDDSGRIVFTLNNSDKDILLFQGRDSRNVMDMVGYTDTENGIPSPLPSRYEIPQAKTPQEKLGIKLSTQKNKLEIEETITEKEGQPNQPSQKEIKAGIKTTVKQAKMPAYAETTRKPRVTEEKFKEFEKQELERKAGSAAPRSESQRNEPLSSSPKAEETGAEEEQGKKKKSIVGTFLKVAGVGIGSGLAILTGGISMDII